MLKKPACPVIAIEEHYWDEELSATYTGIGRATQAEEQVRRLRDLGELRIREMDEAGIDIQVLSHGSPSTQELTGPDGIALTKRVNDRLAEAIARHPTRFAGFCALPTSDPQAAAAELERCIGNGFKGAMIHGLANGVWLDDKVLRPVFAEAERLDVPIYLHPSVPMPAVMDAYYKDYVKDFPMVIRAAWGFTVETATQALRMVLSGVFDKHPNLKIIIGHLGETLPFLVWRVDNALARPGGRPMSFRDVFCNHFYITTSGNFSNPALLCCVQELGIDRILFAIDWPFVPNKLGTDWIPHIPLCEEDKIKLLSGNAQRLLRL
jgi:2,3-dihydroxybenzoate decarboxylase